MAAAAEDHRYRDAAMSGECSIPACIGEILLLLLCTEQVMGFERTGRKSAKYVGSTPLELFIQEIYTATEAKTGNQNWFECHCVLKTDTLMWVKMKRARLVIIFLSYMVGGTTYRDRVLERFRGTPHITCHMCVYICIYTLYVCTDAPCMRVYIYIHMCVCVCVCMCVCVKI